MRSKMFCRDKKAWPDDSLAASFLAMIFISQWPAIICLFSRKYSRENRLILLRVAAFPIFLTTVTPRRVLWNRFGQNIAIKCLFWIFSPNLDNRRNSVRFKILSALAKKKCKSRPSSITRCFLCLFYTHPRLLNCIIPLKTSFFIKIFYCLPFLNTCFQ